MHRIELYKGLKSEPQICLSPNRGKQLLLLLTVMGETET